MFFEDRDCAKDIGIKLGMVAAYAAYGNRNFFERKKFDANFVLKDVEELMWLLERSLFCLHTWRIFPSNRNRL